MNVLGVVRLIWYAAFDAVLPPKERSARTRTRSLEDILLAPTVHELLDVQITTIMEYRDPATRDLIRALKYDGSGAAAALAAAALADYLQEEIATLKQFSAREVLLVPVALHRSRRRERGFNQIEIVLKALPKEFRDGTISRLAPQTLIRTRATRAQTTLHRAERLRNMQNAFEVPQGVDLTRSQVLLIDDVATTGATLKSAAAPLRKAGAVVSLLALARA
ncbi:MAG: hypothetical protein P4L81_04510 [Candidatus Pacebacteria bacterium]|nr:hypothetical protein [Candidatus Paceibacterota bacterium]